MDEKEDLLNSVDKEDKLLDDFIEQTRNAVEIIPYVLEKKKQNIVKKTIIKNTPEDYLSESYPKLIQIQNQETRNLEKFVPQLPIINPEDVRAGPTEVKPPRVRC